MEKDYCVQNDGDCQSCSLVNYGRDCRNNPVEEKIIEGQAEITGRELAGRMDTE